MADPIADIRKGISDAKQGGEYVYKQVIQPSVKNKVLLTFKKDNILIYEGHPNHMIFTWMGSSNWYKMTTGKSSYSKLLLGPILIPELIKLVDDPGSIIRFWNPVIQMKLKETLNEQSNEKEFTCENINSVMNAIFPIISKYKG